MTKVVASVTR